MELSFSGGDALRREKEELIRQLGLRRQIGRKELIEHASTEIGGDSTAMQGLLHELIAAARILSLNEEELYFLEEGDMSSRDPFGKPISIANEQAAVASVLNEAKRVESSRDIPSNGLRSEAQRMASALLSPCSREASPLAPDLVEQDESAWFGGMNGASSRLTIAKISDLRGEILLGAEIEPGETVCSVPARAMLTIDAICNCEELGEEMMSLRKIGDEAVCHLYTLWARGSGESAWSSLLRWVPDDLRTLVWLPKESIDKELAGTPLKETAISYRSMLEKRYHALFPLMSQQLPDHFKPEWTSFEHYLMAVMIWDAYAIGVQFADGTTRQAIIPRLCSLNHGAKGSHIVRFSITDFDDVLRARTVRPLKSGDECLLAYGRLPNDRLLLHYGFAVRDNPNDTHEIEIDASDSCDEHLSELERHGIGLKHLIRQGPLPTRLIGCARIMGCSAKAISEGKGFADPRTRERLEEDERAGNLLMEKFYEERWKLVENHPSGCPEEKDCLAHHCRLYREELLKVVERAMAEASHFFFSTNMETKTKSKSSAE